MTMATDALPIIVAMLGNPNTGKSTLFSALAGIHQRTGNYPGVTVEKKEGRFQIHDQPFVIIDLPGTYSLAPRSPDEMITVDVLLGRLAEESVPNLILCIVDASNLERNLYLVSQVLELGRPTVLALNMTDVAQEKGVEIDVARLQSQLGVPVVPMQANRKQGLDQLREALHSIDKGAAARPTSPFPEAFQNEVTGLASRLPNLPRYLVERLLLDASGYLESAYPWHMLPACDPKNSPKVDRDPVAEEHKLEACATEISQALKDARDRLAKAGMAVPGVEAISRYKWVSQVLNGVVRRSQTRKVTISDRLDRVLTHKVWGTAVFLLLMTIMFQAVTRVTAVSDVIKDGVGLIGKFVDHRLADGALKSLIIHGAIEGVGAVLMFLPQIFALFFFIAVLEDCGYMSRAAYLMDRLMSRVGLSGKSFIPLLSSFACAIPGIMAARVIENRRDRLVTILVAPLMSCSARLPVYTLLAMTFIPQKPYLWGWITLPGMVMLSMYGVGMAAAVVVALLLKKTILKGAVPPFVMELPSYKVPGLRIVLDRMLDRGWAFVRRAGTLIFAITILVWAAGYFPRDASSLPPQLVQEQADLQAQVDKESTPELTEKLSGVNTQIEGEYLRHSYLGRAGRLIEPAVKPLGWDWRIGCAAIASFPAREVVVATLGVIYNLGGDVNEESTSLQETLRDAKWEGTDRPVFNVPVALSLMVFFALCAQCSSTLVIIRRETNSWRWPIFTFVYMTTLAYVGALLTYQIGMRL